MRFSTSRERAIQIKTHQPLQKRERSSTSMVFSSIPAYLDPANWQQQQQPNHHQNHETGGGNAPNDPNPLQLITSPPSSSSHHHQHQHVGGGAAAAAAGMLGSSIRPGSMAERARLANIPLPEAALKCPRCESTNTKFCYFNNYSLTQPRHFCKTCRRYWTRGGALRNVPVGGGCRRNKRSSSSSNKSSNSSNNNKSPVSSSQTHNNNSSSTSSTATVSPTANILGLLNTQQIAPLRFLSPLSQLSQHDQYNTTSNTNPVSGGGGGGDIISLNYNGISGAPAASLLGSTSTHEMNFHNQLGSNNFLGLGGGYNSLLSSNTSSIEQQWRLPFPNLLGGLDSSSLYHHFQGGSTTTTTSNVEPSSGGATFGGGSTEMSHDDQVRPSNYKLSSSMLTQMASIKMEDMNHHHHHHHHHELNLSRQLMGNIPSNNTDDNQWTTGGAAGTAAWTDLSSFSSSSTSNPL